MAGGKETPRQKMINLMYLVLLAMLALQVSSVILEKFQQLNESLESSVDDSQHRNKEILVTIEQAVENNKFAKADVKVLNEASIVRKQSLELLGYINTLKKEMITKTGGRDDLGNYKGAKEEEPISNLMLGAGDSKSGKGYELKSKLDEYLKSMSVIAGKYAIKLEEKGLALDGKDNPMFKNNPDQRRKDFAHLNFEGAPLVAALAVMSERANKVMSLESKLLSGLALEVGATNIPIDKVRPVVKAMSNRVVAGTKYEAEFFMAAYSSTFTPEMTFNSNKLDVDGEGVGKIEFKASGGNYDADGMLKKTWKGTISYPKAGGGDTVYNVTQDYYVVQPAIQVSSSVNSILYKDCGNKLTFQVPALGVDYNPSISASGAKIKNTGNKGEVIIIPNSPEVKVNVSSDGVAIGTKKYKVILMPKPEVIVKCNNRLVDPITGVLPSDLRKVEVIPIADKDFKKSNPEDTRYKTTYWKASLVRNGRVKGQPQIISSQRGNLRRLEARSGDRVIVEKVKIKRKNFENKTLDVKIGDKVFIIPVR